MVKLSVRIEATRLKTDKGVMLELEKQWFEMIRAGATRGIKEVQLGKGGRGRKERKYQEDCA